MKYVLQFKLSADQNDGSEWKGTIEMKVPFHHERLSVIMEASPDGHQPEARSKMAKVKQNLPMLAKIYSKARELIEKVDLVGPEGQTVKTLEQFDTHPELAQGWIVVASQYVEGFGPGKTKSPS